MMNGTGGYRFLVLALLFLILSRVTEGWTADINAILALVFSVFALLSFLSDWSNR